MNRLRVALFSDAAAAEPIQEQLLQAGIPAQIHQEPWLARLWFVSKARAGVRIEVPAKLLGKTEALFRAWDAEGVLFTGIRCPECRSTRVDFPQFTEKSYITNLAIGLLAGIGLVEKEYYCEHCHFMWPKPGAPAHPAISCESQATKPIGRSLFKWWQKLQGKTLFLGGILLLFAHSPGLAESTNMHSPASGTPIKTTERREAGSVNPFSENAPVKARPPTYLQEVLPILMSRCARCHGDPNSVLPNFLDYRTAFGDRTEIQRRVWHSWKGAYFKQPMPAGNNLEAQTMTEAERRIIKQWVENGAPRGVPANDAGFHTKSQRIELGKQLFGTACAICHQTAGQGIPARFPPLAGSDYLNADKNRAIQILINGLRGNLVVNGQKFDNNMPKFPLTDQEIANVLTYVYNSFGNSGKEVTPEEVIAARSEKEMPAIVSQKAGKKFTADPSPFE